MRSQFMGVCSPPRKANGSRSSAILPAFNFFSIVFNPRKFYTRGRLQRHNELNDLIQKALQAAKIPASKEPTGISRSDGKRPDGISLVPWVRGRCLAWDVTCPDTYASSHIQRSSITAGAAAESAESLKRQKYRDLEASHHFVPIAIETSGVI